MGFNSGFKGLNDLTVIICLEGEKLKIDTTQNYIFQLKNSPRYVTDCTMHNNKGHSINIPQ